LTGSIRVHKVIKNCVFDLVYRMLADSHPVCKRVCVCTSLKQNILSKTCSLFMFGVFLLYVADRMTVLHWLDMSVALRLYTIVLMSSYLIHVPPQLNTNSSTKSTHVFLIDIDSASNFTSEWQTSWLSQRQCPSSDKSAYVIQPGNSPVKQLHVCVRLYLLHYFANTYMYCYYVLFLIA